MNRRRKPKKKARKKRAGKNERKADEGLMDLNDDMLLDLAHEQEKQFTESRGQTRRHSRRTWG